MTLVFLMLSVAVRRGCLKRNSLDLGQECEGYVQPGEAAGALPAVCRTHLGGMFSGRLDQSQIQSAFFRSSRSTSLLLSRKSSSDCNQEPQLSVSLHSWDSSCSAAGTHPASPDTFPPLPTPLP